ncbi:MULTISPECIES: MaoC/PaaZ C-terminal domain-containing protein [unclassified Thauera]|jgi:acyl dehydratase|uniref:MaoC/PaaZ C-terminal domain-containing protein n=1 Tax=unclassified Thauera TaxID=2609274 RepID=UPI0002D131C9|nr:MULTISPECIES: MaoC/PaaZ C-terminal domain-containing protein [unclassified Thauera]ENO75672.1 MaoC domain-containing protein dehydratase [Thauera sp. 27]ENO94032.1 MaoC domain-containing protein dehydratase [Thauera sp. 28]WBL64580.1 dehydratase [Thauera sp. WB-2]HRJ24175.1 MaoC/PaaZ C-terminal domain-containing protein [Thauera sp.]HRK10499.1 MaoC/PaaZ C-terminal domain-containing protein [Thauera sp.]
MIYWEDVELDVPRESSEHYVLSAANIKAFASEWDPFPPHVDEAAAARSPIGQLFAAGVHLLSITIRLSHSIPSDETASIAGRGWENLRFHRPGVAGDTLRVRVTHVERSPASRPERGILVSRFELLNQRDEVVVSFNANVVMLRREPLAA